MQQIEQTAGFKEIGLAATGLIGSGTGQASRQRVEVLVETLAALRGEGESLAEVAHDTRNMVTALGLYCDLLEEPGVLTPSYSHYANELRLVATASRRLVEKLLELDQRHHARLVPEEGHTRQIDTPRREVTLAASRMEHDRRWELMPAEPIQDLSGELLANRNLLSALAGPSITLTVDAEGSAQPVRLTGEDLTRILVNLVKNAAEAMPGGGRIAIRLHEFHAGAKMPLWLMLTMEDNGDGIAHQALKKIFDSGYTTRTRGVSGPGGWPASHRGLGLSIVRSIVETAGGHIHAANCAPHGARFEIALPVRPR